MKFREIFRFEFAYQVRRVSTWLYFAALVVFAFLLTRENFLADALRDDFFLNSPFVVAVVTVFGSLTWLLVAAAVAGNAAARDVSAGMYPLTYTAPIRKADYLGGRFLAAFVLNALVLLAVPTGILLAVYSPGVPPEAIGPLRLAAFVNAFFFIALPNAFVATAIQFSLAARSGQPMASYLGSVLLFVGSWIVAGIVYVPLGRPDLGRMVDAIGAINIVTDLSLGWTPIEKRTRLIELEGSLLWNRLLWLGIGLGALAVAHLRFRFAHRTGSTWWRRGTRRREAHAPIPAGIGITARTPIVIPQVRRTFGFGIHARQTLAIAWDSFRTIAKTWTGRALLVAIPIAAVLVVLGQMEFNGVPLVPTTARVINALTAPLTAVQTPWMIIPLLIVFYAGELVWRERAAGLGELTDATPVPVWVLFLGKFLGLGLVLVAWLALLTTAGILAQVLLGYDEFEIGLYLQALFGLQLPEYLLFALLALVIHVVVDQKNIGHLVVIIAYVFIALSSMFGIEHNLLVYGAGPGWSYTEMRGFGPFLGPWLWFKFYWVAWALLLAVVARLLWVRGKERGLGVRLQLARRRFTRRTAWATGAAVALILTLGGFIFYNTNVLNEYLSASEIVELRAEYERRYGRYEGIPQPWLAATNLHVEIYPEQREVEIRATYRLVNSSAVAIDSIHVATAPGVETGPANFDRSATLVLADEDRDHRIYALERPLQPGDSLRLDFDVHFNPRGFRNTGFDASVVANGAYFTNQDWLPAIGYQPYRELTNAGDRRAHGLAPRPLIPSLYDAEARQDRTSAGIDFEAVVGTAEDQIAVAPGALRRTWTEGGRRYFQYATNAPIGNEYAIFSADYAVHEGRWNDPDGSGQVVVIQIYHHPGHAANLDRMLRSVRASLDYYTEQFGPYPYGQIRLVERPGNDMGLHAEAMTIDYQEGYSLFDPEDDPGALDFPFAVMAHEVAHQFGVAYAPVEGAPVMSESFAWYAAIQVVGQTYGREHLRRLLTFMRKPYPIPPIRLGRPLLRAIDPYAAYRKGPFALYALSEYMGEERVNRALRHLIEANDSGALPLATTLDLYRELQAVTPDSLQPLLHDLFEANTFWELETKRATAEQTDAGTWQVTLNVRARKVVVDTAGVETEVSMDDWVEIGVFAPAEEGDEELSEPLYVQRHRIRSGAQTITVTVPRKPLLAGIDPYHLLDWEELADDDNIEGVEIETEGA